jgi:hypothetical protein
VHWETIQRRPSTSINVQRVQLVECTTNQCSTSVRDVDLYLLTQCNCLCIPAPSAFNCLLLASVSLPRPLSCLTTTSAGLATADIAQRASRRGLAFPAAPRSSCMKCSTVSVLRRRCACVKAINNLLTAEKLARTAMHGRHSLLAPPSKPQP